MTDAEHTEVAECGSRHLVRVDWNLLLYNRLYLRIMEIKVLGPGCAKCKTTYNVVEKVIKDNNLDVALTKVDDIMEMMSYNILSTPAVVVNGEVKIKGRVPSETEI